jgi:N6-adenosine-specific RNA methylase IME4
MINFGPTWPEVKGGFSRQHMHNFNIIYADPPWTYRHGGNGGARRHYPLMPIEEICALPVPKLAAPDCALFLWATFPLLPEAFQAIEAWGFTYKTVAFLWVKRNKVSPGYFFGMGNWTRANAEVCLLATKGSPKRINAAVHQIIDAPIERHRKKPDITRDKIIQLFGELPRVELFARQAPPGWDIWGNEVNSTITL